MGGVFSRHSPGCVTGLPSELTKENLEAGLANESISFSEPDFLEAAAEEVAAERSGKVNPEDALAEWNEKHLPEYNRLVGIVIHASTSGTEIEASVMEQVTRYNIEQAELTAAVSKHEEEKKERAAKRAAAKAKAA